MGDTVQNRNVERVSEMKTGQRVWAPRIGLGTVIDHGQLAALVRWDNPIVSGANDMPGRVTSVARDTAYPLRGLRVLG